MAIAQDSYKDTLDIDEASYEPLNQSPPDMDIEAPLTNTMEINVLEQDVAKEPGGGILNNLPFLIIAVILSIVGLVAALVVETQRAASQAEYVERSSKLLALSQQISVDANKATTGDQAAFTTLRQGGERISTIFTSLEKGDPGTRMAPLPEAYKVPLGKVIGLWEDVKMHVGLLLGFREVIVNTRDQVGVVNELAPLLLTKTDEVVDAVIIETGNVDLVNDAARQRSLSQRIAKDVNIYAKGEVDAAAAAAQIGKDLAEFQTSISRLRRVGGPVSLARLEGVDSTFNDLLTSVTSIFKGAAGFFEAKNSSLSIQDATDELLPAVQSLVQNITTSKPTGPLSYLPWALGALIALFLFLLSWALVNDARNRADKSARQNRETQNAILKLLDEMGSLADGDLTIEAEVTDQITGAIADSVNFAVKEMRALVTRINDASQQVARESLATAATAQQLSQASTRQADQITATTERVQEMSRSMEDMSGEALRSADVAANSVEVAQSGAQAVRETIGGMGDMRDQIQETSKRIKRLGESSQQISDIVGLIDDIAEQTNILSLNAAIQAAMAGEAGRGFAVVADEVQRLAERSAEATKQITSLVKNIQADTNEAVTSMEHATQGVVDSTRLADAAGRSLGEIESVSKKMSDLIGNIAQAAHRQSESAVDVSKQMTSIRDSTSETSRDATDTADSIGKLTSLARDLEQSVAGFKIPA